MEDHDASGLKYVAEQVSTMRWDPMRGGTFRGLNIKPKAPKIAWKDVKTVTGDPKKNVIILQNKQGPVFRLFCGEENYETVLVFVNDKVNVERYLQ